MSTTAPATGWPYRIVLDLRAMRHLLPSSVKLLQSRDCTGPAAARREAREALLHLAGLCQHTPGDTRSPRLALQTLDARAASWDFEIAEKLTTKTQLRNGAYIELSIRPIKPRKPRRLSTRPSVPREPTPGSVSAAIAGLEVGTGCAYIEAATPGEAMAVQRKLAVPSRLAGVLKAREFSAALFTAVSAKNCAEVRYLVRVERTR